MDTENEDVEISCSSSESDDDADEEEYEQPTGELTLEDDETNSLLVQPPNEDLGEAEQEADYLGEIVILICF
jgi:hypothetical protein